MSKIAGTNSQYSLSCLKCKSIIISENNTTRIAHYKNPKILLGFLIDPDICDPAILPPDFDNKKVSNDERDVDYGTIYCSLKCAKCNTNIGRFYALVPEELKMFHNKYVLFPKHIISMPTMLDDCEQRQKLTEILQKDQAEYDQQAKILAKLTDMYKELKSLQTDKEQENFDDICKTVDSLMKTTRCVLANQISKI